MADESCLHCGQPAEDDDRETESGRVHERCWDAFSEEKPVAKSSVVAGIFGFSMAAAGATVLSIGLAALAMASVLHSADAQNPLVGIPAAIMWLIAMAVAFSAIPAGAIMLLIALVTYVFPRMSSRPPITVGSIVDSDRSGYRWTAFYQGYLLLAVLSALIALRWGLTVTAIAKVAVFALAFYSLRIPNKTWTRNFHIAINGVATIMPLAVITGTYGYFSILPFDFLLWLPVPTFRSVLPFSIAVVMPLTAGLAATWCYFFVRLEHYR
jgi:hypothetical protein